MIQAGPSLDASGRTLVPKPHPDYDLVQQALRRQPAGLRELARRLHCVPRLLSIRNARLGSPLRPEDLADTCQDVLLIVWRKLEEYRGLSALEGWVYRITLFEFQNALRRRYGREEPVEDELLERGAEPNPWEFEDVHRSLDCIAQVEAEIVRLKHFEDLTFDEIGARLGLSPNTAKGRYYRGLRSLEPLLLERRLKSK